MWNKRIGGRSQHVKNAPDPLWRIDGAWYVCFDNKLIKAGDCIVLSFGINDDPSFDQVMVGDDYKCLVHSFDPIVEDVIFRNYRATNLVLKDAPTLNITPNWVFHKFGIVGLSQVKDKKIVMGSMMTLGEILEYTKLRNQVIY